jgi:4-hydroxy-2-oxoheptanedioate aldolase
MSHIVLLPTDCHNVEQARDCIFSVKPDTPEDSGDFGVAARRFAYMGYGGTQEYVQALRDVVVVLMIEKKGAVDQLEEILALPGLDMIQWGGADYSMSIGKAGDRRSPEIKATEKRVIETAIKMGIPPRAEINTPDDAKYYLDLGVRHFCIGTDIFILYQWFKDSGEGLRRVVEGG